MKYTVKLTTRFRRDYRRAQQKGLDMGPLNAVIAALAAGERPSLPRLVPADGGWRVEEEPAPGNDGSDTPNA